MADNRDNQLLQSFTVRYTRRFQQVGLLQDSKILVALRFQLLSMLFLPQETIVDYGTFSLWGALLNGGQVVTSSLTFRDCLWAGRYFGWTFL